ncbi:hypothetical protein FQN57_007193 [Myotisia sp. PD_48]|nr:hypothetical protein FQN57_007193 [Myotisia sp. PD_48]
MWTSRLRSRSSKSSHYLPVAGSTSPSPSTSSRDTSKGAKDKKSRSNANSPGTKRRSTMNSRDAAYDEEKLLRRAIEESKDDNKSVTDDSGSRRGKRSRSIGEVNKQGAKRQRTSSQSPSTISKLSAPNSYQPSDDESKAKAVANGNQKKTRTATRSQRDKEAEVVEQESEKEANQETVTRRKSRHERRKGDDAEPSEQASPAKPATAQASLVVPDTPTTQPANTSKQPARKTGRPPARRGRLGRNQYTRDRDLANGDNTTAVSNSPRRGQSRDDGHADSPLGGSANGMQTNGGESGKPSKPRYMNPNRTTMNDMRRRVAAILEFISRMQVEMAASGEQATPPDGNGNGAAARLAEAANSLELVTTTVRAEAEAIDDAERVNGGGAVNTAANTTTPAKVEKPIKREFKDLASVEMMDVLTRELLKWQQEYGKYGDK